MFRLLLRWRALTILTAVLLISRALGHGQTLPAPSVRTGVRNVVRTATLPGIDRGLDLTYLSRSPAKSAAIQRTVAARESAMFRAGSSGARYRRGRVIVKFRNSASASSRQAA